MSTQIKLRAADSDDLSVVSAVLQDGLVSFCDMEYLPDERRFVLVINRFRWENGSKIDSESGEFERVHSGVCFDGVTAARYRNLDRRDRTKVLELLAIKAEDGFVDLLFAGRGRVRLEVDGILCHVQDLDEPWPTQWRPHHDVADAG